MKKDRGITLVALVITIIIIIILATIAISFAFGDNGLIKQAEIARDMSTNSSKYEEESVSNLFSYLEEIENPIRVEDVKPKDGEEIYVFENTKKY